MAGIGFNWFKSWEYWPTWLFYVPNVPYACYLALRAGSPVFYTAANPAVRYSGNGSESKYDTLMQLPEEVRPMSIRISKDTSNEEVLQRFVDSGFEFPVIVKPDIGFRGLLVKKIQDTNALEAYLERYGSIDLLIQEFVSLSEEAGIFYHRIPGKKSGTISSVTLKEFPEVVGNGRDSVADLLQQDHRLRTYTKLFLPLIGNERDRVLERGERFRLSVIGNHSKGTRFIYGAHRIDDALVEAMDRLFDQMPGWNYGRLDLKFKSWDDLLKGKNLKVLELNGIISEPTHIYDADAGSYWSALKSIRTHWKCLWRVAIANHRSYSVPYAQLGGFLKSLGEIRDHVKQIRRLSRS
jgi:hypothetical protein